MKEYDVAIQFVLLLEIDLSSSRRFMKKRKLNTPDSSSTVVDSSNHLDSSFRSWEEWEKQLPLSIVDARLGTAEEETPLYQQLHRKNWESEML